MGKHKDIKKGAPENIIIFPDGSFKFSNILFLSQL